MRRAALLATCLAALLAAPGCGQASGVGANVMATRSLPPLDDHWTGANAQLAKAAARGDASGIRDAIRAGADVNAVSAEGMPMILWPALGGSLEGFAALLDAGANAEAAFDGDAIATEMLVRLEDQRFLGEALARGADPNAVGSNTEPLIWKAHFADRWDAIQTLIESGADVDAFNHGEHGATLLANYSRGAYDKAIWLMKRGANPTWRIQTAPPGYEDRVGAMPILENIYYYEVDAEAFPEIARAQREAQELARDKGYPVPPRPKRYALR